MPFDPNYHWRIMRILEVQVTTENEQSVKAKLSAIAERSEIWVDQIKKLVQNIENFEESVKDASTGLIQVDVIKWEEQRYCSAMQHLEYLKKQLARAIGISLDTFNPFAINEKGTNYDRRFNKLRCEYIFEPPSRW